MRTFHRLGLLVLAALSISACSNPFAATQRVEVRFRNATSQTLSDISIQWPGGSMQASQLAPGSMSSYEQHDGAYGYGALSATANGTVRRLIVIDYVGEQPLTPGRYTYVISLRTSTYQPDGLDLTLETGP
jgi:hypothetical protein